MLCSGLLLESYITYGVRACVPLSTCSSGELKCPGSACSANVNIPGLLPLRWDHCGTSACEILPGTKWIFMEILLEISMEPHDGEFQSYCLSKPDCWWKVKLSQVLDGAGVVLYIICFGVMVTCSTLLCLTWLKSTVVWRMKLEMLST